MKNCCICKVDRHDQDIYFKFRKQFMCSWCLMNGLTRNAEGLFDETSVDAELYYRKIRSLNEDEELFVDG